MAEEKFLGDFDSLDPLILVAGEGVAGVILFIVLLPILQLIPCDDERMCTNGVISDSV